MQAAFEAPPAPANLTIEKMWPWSKIRILEAELSDARSGLSDANETAQSLATDLEQAQLELKTEHTLRISAEAIAAERLAQVTKAYEFALRAENARDEAVKGRMASLDLMNTKFLGMMAPEQPPTNLKEFSTNMQQLPNRKNGVGASRAADLKFVADMIAKSKKTEPKITPTDGVIEDAGPTVAAV